MICNRVALDASYCLGRLVILLFGALWLQLEPLARAADGDAELVRLVPQLGHSFYVSALAVSPDGRILASGGQPSTIALWNLQSGRFISFLAGHENFVSSLAFSPDGHVLLSGSQDATARLWDLSSGTELHRLIGHEDGINAVAFSPLGELVATGGENGDVILWGAAAGCEVCRLVGHKKPVNSVAFTLDGGSLLTASDDGSVRRWNVRTCSANGFLHRDSWEVNSIIVSPDGTQAFVGGLGDSSLLLGLPGGEQIRDLPGGGVQHAVFTDDANQLLTADLDKEIALWEVRSGRKVCRLRQTEDFIGGISLWLGDSIVLEATGAGIDVQDLESGDVATSLRPFTRVIQSLSISNNTATMLAATGRAGSVWNLGEGREITRRQSTSGITATALSADGRLAFSGGGDNAVTVWSADTGGELFQLPHLGKIRDMALSADETMLLTGTDDGDAHLWSLSSKAEVCTLKGHSKGVRSVMLTPLADSAVTVDGNGIVRVWSLGDGKVVAQVTGVAAVHGAALSPSGRQLVFVTSGQRLALLNLEDPHTIREFVGDHGPVASIAWSRDGKHILTGSGDRLAFLWDAVSGTTRCELLAHEGLVTAASFSADSRYAITGGWDGTVKLWSVDRCNLVATLSPFIGGHWAVVLPDGRFDADTLDDDFPLQWIARDEPLRPMPLAVFQRDYFTPRLLQDVLQGHKLANIPSVATLNRAQPAILSVAVTPSNRDLHSVSVAVTVRGGVHRIHSDETPQYSGVYDLHLFRDGQLVARSPAGGQAELAYPDGDDSVNAWRNRHEIRVGVGRQTTVHFDDVQLPADPPMGATTFAAYAFNADRVKGPTSEPVTFQRHDPGSGRTAPRAYVILMGVNANESHWNLEFAVDSARAIGSQLRQRLLSEYEVVRIDLFSDLDPASPRVVLSNATKANLATVMRILAGEPVTSEERHAVDPLTQLRRATPDDALVLYASAHGYTDSRGRYFMIPYDTGVSFGVTAGLLSTCDGATASVAACRSAAEFLSRCISGEDLTDWFEAVDAGEMIMILDTCHSGAVPGRDFRPGPLGDPTFGQLSYNKAMRVLCASQSDKTIRATYLHGIGHSLLVEGLLRTANSDSPAGFGDWLKAASSLVPRLTRDVYAGVDGDTTQSPLVLDFSARRLGRATSRADIR